MLTMKMKISFFLSLRPTDKDGSKPLTGASFLAVEAEVTCSFSILYLLFETHSPSISIVFISRCIYALMFSVLALSYLGISSCIFICPLNLQWLRLFAFHSLMHTHIHTHTLSLSLTHTRAHTYILTGL